MTKVKTRPLSDVIRQYAQDTYVRAARRRAQKSVSINVGEVHKAVALHNRVPLVCQALKSEKFLAANGLKLISQIGPPSGQSTTVTYTYQFVDTEAASAGNDPWLSLRGALKNVFSELGGGEAYLHTERESFYDANASPRTPK